MTPQKETHITQISLRGVRTHNLKNIDLDIPHGKLVVITGPSGSGKSSLAFDTIYAEAQRQFIESLSIEARQHFKQLERPDADYIDGLQPTICIDQKSGSGNRRSTIATVTEIYDHLRLLVARAGQVHCVKCDRPIERHTPAQIQRWVKQLPEKTRFMILAPFVREEKGTHEKTIAEIRKLGYVRVRVDDQIMDIDQVQALDPKSKHSIEAVVDRLVVRQGFESRLSESILQTLKQTGGSLIVFYESPDEDDLDFPWYDEYFSTQFACSECDQSYDEVEPRTFSFNSPYGACPSCKGLGLSEQFDPDSIVEWNCSLDDDAVIIWKHLTKSAVEQQRSSLCSYLDREGFDMGTPLKELSQKQRSHFIFGVGKKFLGLQMMLEKEFVTTTVKSRLEELSRFRAEITCRACNGSRLRPEANFVRIGGKNIHEISQLTVSEAIEFFQSLEVTESKQSIAERIIPEIIHRLNFLEQVGAGYLSLGRSVNTLSGGEFQRVRLANGIGSGLSGICYVLDEPSIGLHERDNQRLIESLLQLKANGNSVIIVEHDESMIREAELLIDIGPKAGTEGGQVIACGTVEQVTECDSATGRMLAGEMIAVPQKRAANFDQSISIQDVTTNNLKNVSALIPLRTFTCVTGVSGSGKSSLINATLIPALIREKGGVRPVLGSFQTITGAELVDHVVEIDQSPIGRSSRSNAATYTGIYDEIRKIYAATKQAKQLGFKASQFSFNAKAGRCPECMGHGTQKIEMSFLPDIHVTCETCDGQRYNAQTLQVKFRGKTIAEVLDMSVDQAATFFENVEKIAQILRCLQDVGLGYLPIGQPASTISGGEAQRIKLAASLGKPTREKTIYFLDEPTTGLHFVDIQRLLKVLHRFVDQGNTVVVIEHNLDVIKQADWIIDLGPEGGACGGQIIATGPPKEIAKETQSHTGKFL